MTNFAEAVEQRFTIENLRAAGGIKWTHFPDTIGAFVAEMDLGTAPEITDALHRMIDDGLFGYLPQPLSKELSAACASWQKDAYGWDISADRIHAIPDVLSALGMTIEHFTTPGSAIIVPTPAYMPFLKIPGMHAREIIQVPMLLEDGRYVLDLDAIDQAFADGAGLFILCNPYNPLGRVFDRDELTALSTVVQRHGGRVFSDEIHSPVVFAPHQHIPYASLSEETAGHTITAVSASKAWNLPGLKAAQVIFSNDADAAAWERPEVSWPLHGASNPGVVANIAAYTGGRQWQSDSVEYLDGNRILLGELLAEHIPDMGYIAAEGTYIAWLDARKLGIDGSPAAFFRKNAGVALTDGADCGAAGEGYLRFIFATTRPIIEQAVRQMAAALHARG